MDQDNLQVTLRLRLLIMLLICTAFSIKSISMFQRLVYRIKYLCFSSFGGEKRLARISHEHCITLTKF
jgi:hypothetical protein